MSALALRDPPQGDEIASAAVALGNGLVGGHAGIYYARENGTTRLLHLAGHVALRDDSLDGGTPAMGWVEPSSPSPKLEVLAELCAFVADRVGARRVPYGFRFEATGVESDGRLVIGPDERGLTCATFVLALCDRAHIVPLDRQTWSSQPGDARRAEDRAAQQELVNALAQRPRPAYQAHARLLAREIGAPRYRAEEIAAASGSLAQPLDYERAAVAGAALLMEGRSRPWW